MSKKRDKNKRNKLLKKRKTEITIRKTRHKENILNGLDYEITDKPIADEAFRQLPDEIQDELEELYENVQYKPKGTVERLIALTRKYPHIPQLFNYLYAAYVNTGQLDKATEIMMANYQHNPDYLFAKLNYSDYLAERNELDEIYDIYQGKFSLNELYPDRKSFHVTEVVCFHGVVGYYFYKMNNFEKAKQSLNILKELSPDHGYTVRLQKAINTGTILYA